MVRAGVVEHDVPDHNKKFLALAAKAARQRVLPSDVNQPFTNPLPELPLCGPELVVIGTDYSRRLLCFHRYTPCH